MIINDNHPNREDCSRDVDKNHTARQASPCHMLGGKERGGENEAMTQYQVSTAGLVARVVE